MTNKDLNAKKIKLILSQKIKNAYKKQLKHNLSNVSCQLNERTIIITLEGVVTSPENILKDSDRLDLAKQMRKAVDGVLHPQIKNIIEEVLQVKVIDFLSDTTIEQDLTGVIAIFEFKPKDT